MRVRAPWKDAKPLAAEARARSRRPRLWPGRRERAPAGNLGGPAQQFPFELLVWKFLIFYSQIEGFEGSTLVGTLSKKSFTAALFL